MAEGRERWPGRRAAGAAVVAFAVAAVVGWNAFIRDSPRVEIGELSCTSGTFSETAVDFAGVPSWESAQEALDYALSVNGGAPTDGWTLRMTGDTARWERHEGGHLVGLAEFPKLGSGWGYGGLHACGETYTPPH